MNILDTLIMQGEGPQLDFKKTISNPDKIAKTLVAFANHRGGQLLVGVMDDGYVSGIDAEEEKYILEKAAGFYCKPALELDFEEIDDEGKTVLLVTVHESNRKPHAAKVGPNDWRVYIRVDDQSVLASRLVEKAMTTAPVPVPRHLTNIEKALTEHLAAHRRITLKQYCTLVNISKRRAQRVLIALTLDGVLRLHETEKEAYYTLA